MTYMQSSAGRRFHESPSLRRAGAVRATRAHLVVRTGGVHCVSVARRDRRSRRRDQPAFSKSSFPFVIGAAAVAIGVGFVVSAAVAYGLSHRLGLLNAAPATTAYGTDLRPSAVHDDNAYPRVT